MCVLVCTLVLHTCPPTFWTNTHTQNIRPPSLHLVKAAPFPPPPQPESDAPFLPTLILPSQLEAVLSPLPPNRLFPPPIPTFQLFSPSPLHVVTPLCTLSLVEAVLPLPHLHFRPPPLRTLSFVEAVLVEALPPLPLVAGREVDADDEVRVFEARLATRVAQLVQRVEVLREGLEVRILRSLQYRPVTRERERERGERETERERERE